MMWMKIYVTFGRKVRYFPQESILGVPLGRYRKYQNLYRAGIYFFKVSNGNTRTKCEMFSELTIKIPERRQ